MSSITMARVAPEKAVFRPALPSFLKAGFLPERDMTTYWEKLRDPHWQKRRLEIMGRDGFRCRLCGDDQATLNVHHLFYEKGADPWDYPDTSLVTTCEPCHEDLHVSRFGARIVEAAIAGEVHILELHALASVFESAFLDGPEYGPMPKGGWDAAVFGFVMVLRAARHGVSREQLEAIAAQLEAPTEPDESAH